MQSKQNDPLTFTDFIRRSVIDNIGVSKKICYKNYVPPRAAEHFVDFLLIQSSLKKTWAWQFCDCDLFGNGHSSREPLNGESSRPPNRGSDLSLGHELHRLGVKYIYCVCFSLLEVT